MTEIKSELIKGIKSAKQFGYVISIFTIFIFILSWFIYEPYGIDNVESFLIAYCFGCFMGVMTGMSIIRGHVKEYIKE